MKPPWRELLPWEIINDLAKEYNLDPNLIAAMIMVESRCDTYSIRYEPLFEYRYQPERFAKINRITELTENFLQASSIGLMHVMGCVARELGHIKSLLELVEPEVGIEYGCKKLALLSKRYSILEDIISAYNSGSVRKDKLGVYINIKHVKKVMEKLKELQGL